MRRPGGKAAKTHRPKTLKRRNAPKTAHRSGSSVAGKETNAQLRRERDEALEQQTATSEVLKVISSSTGELQPVFQTMLENAVRICEAKFGVLFRVEDGAVSAAAMFGVPQKFAEFWEQGPRRPGRGTALGRAVETRQIVHVADVKLESAYVEGEPVFLAAVSLGGFRTLIVVPMLKDNELIGLIGIYRQEVRPFTDKQIELVKNFASQAVIAIENTRLLNELRESLQQQTATADVLKVISRSTFDLQVVLDTLVESAVRLCEAERGLVFRREGETYNSVAYYNYSPEFRAFHESHPITPGRGTAVGRTALEGKSVQIVDILADPEYTFGEAQKLGGGRATLAVPLLRQGAPIGALSLQRTEPRPYSRKQIELVETFADQAVIAIENARLLSELRESLEQQTAAADVLKVISSSPGELEPVFDTMLENATRICEGKMGVLFLREGETYRAVAVAGDSYYAELTRREPRVDMQEISHHGTPLYRLLRSKTLIHIHDLREDASYRSGNQRMKALVETAGARTHLVVPMLKDEELVGAIVIYRQEVRPFSDKQIDLVQNFAAQAVIAIENARLLNELRRRTDDLSESLDQQTATSEVLKVISSSSGKLEPVFRTMLANATRICEAAFGSMLLLENGGFRRVALHNAPPLFLDFHKKTPVIPTGTVHDLNRLLETKRPVHIEDAAGIEDSPIAKYGGARTLAIVPMLKESEVVGAIGIYRQEVRPFTDKQIELVTNFAAQAVIAIENTRLLSELRESLQQQTATADVLKVISRSAFDLQTVLNTLVESAARLCDADQGTITRQIDATFYRAATYGHSSEFSEYLRDLPVELDRGSATGRALVEGQIIHVPDVQADPGYTFSEALKRGGFRTALGVPMMREGVPIGAIALTRSEVRPFTDKQIELVTTFADQAAIAIENVRLFDSVEARTRELAQSLEDLRTTQDRLVQTQKLASLGQLTAGIAHEIKNPLNFVNNFSGISSELIDELQDTLSGPLDDKARAEIAELANTLRGNLDKVVQHGKRADAIVKNMLLHSREGSSEHRVVDINALVEESLNLAYHGARAEKQGFNITMERSLDPAAGEVDLFPQDITRVLLNLISNGFYAATKRKTQAGHDGYEPTLSASTRSLGDQVEIRIRDNGTGIPPEVKEKMFNPFFTTKPAGEGTGLGLSISHDIIVKQHGGSIEVDTQLGDFTEIRVILPRAAALLPERS
jgi:two-component system, NtrC family, sensor kinase